MKILSFWLFFLISNSTVILAMCHVWR